MKRFLVTFALIISLSHAFIIHGRDIRRPIDKTIPSISIQPSNINNAEGWYSTKTKKKTKKKASHTLTNPYLRINPIFKGFDHTFFKKHYIPENTSITFRNNKGSVNTQILETLAEELVAEVQAGQRTFLNFKVIKDKDFNYNELSGLLVLKYKDYPFIIKLAIEHPHTMIQPYAKSFESKFIFIFGGNIRHLSNFTRISNLEDIKKILSYNPYYLEHIDFPRKWYWKPQNNYDLHITWNKTPYKDAETFIIPSIYAVIADYIDIDTTYPQSELNKIAMKVATDVEFRIDPHAGNFVVEKGSTKYTMLDTENFRIMTGLDRTMNARKYISWFLELSMSCLHVYCGRDKEQRIKQCFTILD